MAYGRIAMPITTEILAKAGVVGAGGAGFPTHVKLSGKADTVVINGAECEPLLHKDKELLVKEGRAVIEGLARAMELTGARRGVVGIKRKYQRVIDSVAPLLREGMSIGPLDDVYPSGDEFILIWQTLGRVIPPGGIPLAVGAVVMNVETALNVARAEELPVVDKYITVAGAVRNPCSVCVPIGAPLSVCLAAAGGAEIDDPSFILGGAMMGTLVESLDGPVTKTTGGIIVLPKDHFIVRRKSWSWERTRRVARAACDQCSHCTEMCPRYLLGHPIEPAKSMRSVGFSGTGRAEFPGTLYCSECNLCSYCSCPEGLDPKGVNAENKRRLMAEKKRMENPPFHPERAARMMSMRQTPTHRLMQRIGLDRFVNKGELLGRPIEVRAVELPLKQHIGAPLTPTVHAGQQVHRGEPVAVRPVADGKPALGADLHASIDGVVTAVSDESIRIEA